VLRAAGTAHPALEGLFLPRFCERLDRLALIDGFATEQPKPTKNPPCGRT